VGKGKPLIIHFWTTSCPACKLEAPNIETVSKEYDVLTVAVNSGSDEEVKNYIQENGLSFNVLNDVNGAWTTEFNIEVFPTTFIYDAKGKLRFTEVGYTTTAGLLARLEWIE
jgi:thiol-disulfide isomerase/thioredoxin